MKEVFQHLTETLASGEPAVLVSIEASSGSAPRGPGACMAVTAKGRAAGSIGGGAVEHRSEQIALEVLNSGISREETFPLHPGQAQDLDMICGGEVRVSFHYLAGGSSAAIAWVERAEACRLPPGKVYIFGGGHVARALVPALTAVDFRCVVLEDRPEFCRRELFPDAEEILLMDNAHVADFITITQEDWAVIMTRGHKADLLVQSQVMKTPARYIGVIGSRQKTAAITAKLREMGFSEADFRRVWAPIGLPIRSETPAEIAVSIATQMILERAGGLAKEAR